ncbi:MAG: hypothetical protein AB7K86_24435 [Rhodospirillales bacterium]
MKKYRPRGAERVVRNIAVRRYTRAMGVLGAIVAGAALWAYAMLSMAGFEVVLY